MQRLEHRQVGRGARVAAIGREIEQHDRQLAIGKPAASQGHEFRNARGQHVGALAVYLHVAGGLAAASPVHHAAGGAIQLRDRHHDRGLHRQQPAIGGFPLLDGLEFHRMRDQVGHVEFREHLFGRARVVVGRAADQREAGERHQGLDGAHAIAHEVLLDGGPGIEAARKRREHAQPACLERGDHAVVVLRIAGEHVGAQHQQPYRVLRIPGSAQAGLRAAQSRAVAGAGDTGRLPDTPRAVRPRRDHAAPRADRWHSGPRGSGSC